MNHSLIRLNKQAHRGWYSAQTKHCSFSGQRLYIYFFFWVWYKDNYCYSVWNSQTQEIVWWKWIGIKLNVCLLGKWWLNKMDGVYIDRGFDNETQTYWKHHVAYM